MDALQAAVEGAGAVVVARVNHAAAAAKAGLELPPAQVLIFGNPMVGTPAMRADIRASFYLPLKVAVYEAEGGATLAYEAPAQMFAHLGIAEDASFVQKMTGALATLTAKAAE